MKKTFIIIAIIMLVGLFSSGCATTMVVPEPRKITLKEALESVGEGLIAMKIAQNIAATNLVKYNREIPTFQTGLIPDEVEVTFNISASGEDSTKLYVDLNPTNILNKSGSELGSNLAAKRSNQIKINFKNIIMSKKTINKDGSITYETLDSGSINNLIDVLRKNNFILLHQGFDMGKVTNSNNILSKKRINNEKN